VDQSGFFMSWVFNIAKNNIKWQRMGDKVSPLPNWYLGKEIDYHIRENVSEEKLRADVFNWLSELTGPELLGPVIDDVFVSGSIAIHAITNKYNQGYLPPNTDLALKKDPTVLERIVQNFRERNYFLVERISGKIRSKSKNKVHAYHPVSVGEVINKSKYDQNYELAKVDPSSNAFETRQGMANHIRLYLHTQVGNYVVCNEDKPKFNVSYPAAYFTGVPFKVANGKKILLMSPEYLEIKKREIIEREGSKNPRHFQDLEDINALLLRTRTEEANNAFAAHSIRK